MNDQLIQKIDLIHGKLDTLDYYQLLRVTPDAPLSEIKRKFYEEARKFHPDTYFNAHDLPEGTRLKIAAIYRRLSEAYSILGDPIRRLRYMDGLKTDRNSNLRYSVVEEERKLREQKRSEEEAGTTQQGQRFYKLAMTALGEGNRTGALLNIKTALRAEPANERFKAVLAELEQKAK